MRNFGLTLGLAATLASCGGGGDGGSPPAPPTGNSAPRITSAANLDLVENDLDGLEITAADADGDAIAFQVVGGADADLFAFENNRLYILVNADFERPVDADGNNIYEVVIEVSDGEASNRQTLRITVVNDREGFVLRRIRGGLGTVAAASVADGNRIWVVRTDGSVWQENVDDDQSGTLGRVAGFDGGGDNEILSVGSIAAASDTLNTLILSRHGSQVRLTEYRPAEIAGGTPGTLRWSLAFDAPQTVSASLFAERGQMLVALGDNGNPVGAQDPDTPFGGLFRIVGTSNSGLSLERAGYGLRDPRLGFHTDEQLRVIDRGLLQDEINEQVGGDNFEWPLRDGTRNGPVATVPFTPGTFASPTFARPSGDDAGESGTFVDYVEGVRICSLDDITMVVGTREGRFFTGNPRTPRFEERTQDFLPNEGSIDEVVAVELLDDVYFGRQATAAIIDRDGEIFFLQVTFPCDRR